MSVSYAVFVLVAWVLAVMRLTRLINGDKITDFLRLYPAGKIKTAEQVQDEALAHGQLARAQLFERQARRWDAVLYFVECPWCVGMWLSFGTAGVPLFFSDNPVAWYAIVALAASHLIGVCARFADTEEVDIEDAEAQ